jgi:hypothetical protein
LAVLIDANEDTGEQYEKPGQKCEIESELELIFTDVSSTNVLDPSIL